MIWNGAMELPWVRHTNYGSVSWQMKRLVGMNSRSRTGASEMARLAVCLVSGGAWGGGQNGLHGAYVHLINYGFSGLWLDGLHRVKFSAHYGAICAGPPSQDSAKKLVEDLGCDWLNG